MALGAGGDGSISSFQLAYLALIGLAIEHHSSRPHLHCSCCGNRSPTMGSLGEPTFSEPTEVVSADGFLFDFDGKRDTLRAHMLLVGG